MRAQIPTYGQTITTVPTEYQTIVITIPVPLVPDFVNHLGRLHPDKAKHITITIPSEEQQRDITDLMKYHEATEQIRKDEDMIQQWNKMPQYLKNMNK